jgi:hypothetical protein
MRAVKSFLVVTSLVLQGCKKEKPAPPPPAPVTGSATAGSNDMGSAAMGSGSAAMGSAAAETAGSGQLQDVGSAVDPTAMSHHAEHCPSMVRGATTTAKLDGKSVVVTITSDDKAAMAKIQARADQLLADKAKLGSNAPPAAAHEQNGIHGGGIGICPVYVPEGATAKSAKVGNGVAVTITPKSGADALDKDIEQRITRAADWVKSHHDDDGGGGGTGGGGGNGTGGGKHGH